MANPARRLTLKLLLLFGALWIAVMAFSLNLAALPDNTSGRVLVVFPPTLDADARLLAIAQAEGRPVLSLLGGVMWLTESEQAGFVGRLETAGALAAYQPDIFSVLPQGGCFYISVHPPGPPQPHTPI